MVLFVLEHGVWSEEGLSFHFVLIRGLNDWAGLLKEEGEKSIWVTV